jgi:hypothetical protein
MARCAVRAPAKAGRLAVKAGRGQAQAGRAPAEAGHAPTEAGRGQAKADQAPAQGKCVQGGSRDLAAEFFSGEVRSRVGGRRAMPIRSI